MPSKLIGKWNIIKLLQSTQNIAPNRFLFSTRDVVKSRIQIQKITVYDGKDPGAGSRTVYKIRSKSFPQYYPYYTKYDNRGRKRSYQRTYAHEYDVIISLDYLTLTTPVKILTGSQKKWIFNPSKNLIKSKNNPYAPYLSVGDYNAKITGVNADHFFTQSYNRFMEGCLYGKTYVKSQPEKYKIPFLTKHEISVILNLMNRGYFSKE